MPVQLYTVQQPGPQAPQAPQPPNLERFRHELKAEVVELVVNEVQQITANIIPTLRNELRSELHSETQSLEQRLGAQLALAFEKVEQQTNELHARIQEHEKHLQMMETHVERGKKRPALRLAPSLPTTTPEGPRGYHEPTASSLRGACGGGAADPV